MSATLPAVAPLFAPTLSAGERALDGVRVELARAVAPVSVNRARLSAEVLEKALENAVKAGCSHLRELHREAQLLTLEATIRFGEKGLKLSNQGGSKLVGTKAIQVLAEEAGLPVSTMRDHAKLALARRVAEAAFDRMVTRALDDGKPLPLSKLRALTRPPKAEKAEPEAGDDQIAFRVTKSLGARIDWARKLGGGDPARATWVRDHLERVLAEDLRAALEELLHLARHTADELVGQDVIRWRGVLTALERVGPEIDKAARS